MFQITHRESSARGPALVYVPIMFKYKLTELLPAIMNGSVAQGDERDVLKIIEFPVVGWEYL